MLEHPSIRQYAQRNNLFGADDQQATRLSSKAIAVRSLRDCTSDASVKGVKIQSALHGDMQRSAEMTDPLDE